MDGIAGALRPAATTRTITYTEEKEMIGSDFESFMSVNGAIMPATDGLKLGDKKGDHIPLTHGTMHRDNVMVELCTNPVNTASEFEDTCIKLAAEAGRFLHYNRGIHNAVLVHDPFVEFPADQLVTNSARELGCDIDYLAAVSDSVPRMPITPHILGNYRCAGGHIHISYGDTEKVPEAIAAGFCDIALGGLELQMGTQGVRRQHYGLAGLHRRKTYGKVKGVEYRTVSNLWLRKRSYANAMGTNALALQRVFETRPALAISNVWKELIADRQMDNILRDEDANAALQQLRKLKAHFPDVKWALEV